MLVPYSETSKDISHHLCIVTYLEVLAKVLQARTLCLRIKQFQCSVIFVKNWSSFNID